MPRPRQLFAAGLILIGLGVPRLVDAVEIAYSLDVKRDVGVLPWLVLTALGVVLFLWYSRPAARSLENQMTLRSLGWTVALGLGLSVAALSMVLAFGGGPLERVLASGSETAWLAGRGLLLNDLGVGAVVGSWTADQAGGSR